LFQKISSECTALKHLIISDCPNLDESFIKHLEWMQTAHLQTFNLSRTPISISTWITSIHLFSQTEILVSLDLSKTGMTDQCLNQLVKSKKLPNLQTLKLAECEQITDEAMYALVQACPALTNIDLRQLSQLSGRTLDYFGTFYTNVKSLWVDGCFRIFGSSETNDDPFALFVQNNLGLSVFSANGTMITDSHLSHMNLLKDLEHIGFQESKVTSVGIEHLATLNRNINNVNVSNCQMEDSLFGSLKKASGALKELDISSCRRLSNEAISDFASYLGNVVKLSLANVKSLNDKAVEQIALYANKLQNLNLSNSQSITSKSIASIANIHTLQYLDCSQCPCVGDVGPLGSGCPQLQTLLLQKNSHIMSGSIIGLCKLPFLSELNLADVKDMGDDLMRSFDVIGNWPALKILLIGGQNKISRTSEFTTRNGLQIIRNSLKASTENNLTKSQPSAQAQRILMRDYKLISQDPFPMISAAPLQDDYFRWHCNLQGPEGTPYAGAIFHLQLTFPADFPNSPPSGSVLTPLPHPHVLDGKICLDILSDFAAYFSTSSQGGWSSAYTVQTILLQLQTFLMDFEDVGHGTKTIDEYLCEVPNAITIARNFSCPDCGHSPNHIFPPFASLKASTPRSVSEKSIICDELKCYHTRRTFEEDILGIGITSTKHESGRHHQLSSPLDLLSYSAFKEGVREAVYDVDSRNQKVTFSHWLPLYICKEHAERARELMEYSLRNISADGDKVPDNVPDMALNILPKLMNTMVVKLMSGQTVTSVRALEGYIWFHRILIMFIKENPQLTTRLNKKISNFISQNTYRTKAKVPDLGEFLCYLAVTDYAWKDVASVVVEETLTRNVRWAIEKYPELAKETLDPEIDKHRTDKTFLASQVSLKLLCFHVVFLQCLSEKSLDDIISEYDSHYGKPSVEMKHNFFEGVKKIKNLNSWEEFFGRIGVPYPENLDERLRECVKRSAQLQYHGKTPTKPKNNRSAKKDGAWANNAPRGGIGRGSSQSPEDSPASSGRGGSNNRGGGRGAGLTHSQPAGRGRQPPVNPRAPVCDYWSNGQACPHGAKCRFLHK